MSKDLTIKRYNCYEEMRNIKIEQIIEFRDKLINQENEKKNDKEKKKEKVL